MKVIFVINWADDSNEEVGHDDGQRLDNQHAGCYYGKEVMDRYGQDAIRKRDHVIRLYGHICVKGYGFL